MPSMMRCRNSRPKRFALLKTRPSLRGFSIFGGHKKAPPERGLISSRGIGNYFCRGRVSVAFQECSLHWALSPSKSFLVLAKIL